MAPDFRGPSARLVLVAVVVAVLIAVGVWVFLAPGNPLPSADEAAQRYSSLDAYNATYAITFDRPNETRTVRVHTTVSPDSGELRSAVLAPPDRAGSLRVYNGSVLWLYNATRNRVTRVTQAEPQLVPQQRALVRNIVAGANGEETSTRVSPLPVVPSSTAAPSAGNATGELEASYVGTDTVAGRETYVVTMTPTGDATTVIRNETVWLDTEHFVPLRARMVLEYGERSTVVTQRATAVSFGPDLSAGIFEFEPPPGAQPARTTADVTTYDSRAALRAATELPVPDPTVPGRFELERAQLNVRPNRTGAVLRYTSGVNLVSVIAGNGSEFDASTGDPVAIGNRTGRFDVSDHIGRVVWTCGEYEYAVAGTVSKQTLTDVARSVADRSAACTTARTGST